MAAFRRADLSAAERLVAWELAWRATKFSPDVRVSTRSLAADTGLARNTVRDALRALVDKQLISVEKVIHKTSVYRLAVGQMVPQGGSNGDHLWSPFDPPLEVLESKRREQRAPRAGWQAVDNTNWSVYRRSDQDDIDSCPYCDRQGWLERDGVYGRCSHQPVMPASLTVDDVLGVREP
jgi:hypothetical protein